MSLSGEYPPPKINELLRAKNIPETALRPSYDQMAAMARQLGSMIVADCSPKMPNEVFDIMVAVPRGGFFLNDVLAHAFGFNGPRLQMVGITSYEEDGQTQSEELTFTQLPEPHLFEDATVLVPEDVCDSGRTLKMIKDLLLGDITIPERTLQNPNGSKLTMPRLNYRAKEVKTASIYHKPELTKTDFVPDYYVAETSEWVVFPGEVYEQLGTASLDETLWTR